jgi:hypothetical protein
VERSERDKLVEWYRSLADDYLRGRSPIYEELCRRVADDSEILDLLECLPFPKRQPNLLLASYRWLFEVPADYATFKERLRQDWPDVAKVMLARSTQTNEPGRCAVLLPALARLPQPLALIEVGTSAGLCLLPDLYDYDYGDRGRVPSHHREDAPLLPCRADAATPIPTALPEIVWRAGIDLDPIDVNDEAAVRWLQMLVWPEQTDRQLRLAKAAAIARDNRVRIQRGDLRTDFASLASEAPTGATLVVFHTAVLAYVDPQEARDEFARTAEELCDVWLSNEDPRVFPAIATAAGPAPTGKMLLAQNGRPLAWTDPHGATLDWIEQLQ